MSVGRDEKVVSAVRSVDLTATALLAAGKTPAGWKDYFSSSNEFAVWIPEKARSQYSLDRDVTVNQVRIRGTSLRVEMAGDLMYMVDVFTIARGLFNRVKREEWDEGFRNWVESERRGKVVEDTEVQLGAIPGREFRIEAPGRASRARLFVVGDGKVVVLQVAAQAADLNGESAHMFLRSFRMTPALARKAPLAPPLPGIASDRRRVPSSSPRPYTSERVKLPSAADREKVTRLARELFKEEFALTDAAAKTDFATRLFNQAAETDDDPVSQFVLYRESAELAASLDMELA